MGIEPIGQRPVLPTGTPQSPTPASASSFATQQDVALQQQQQTGGGGGHGGGHGGAKKSTSAIENIAARASLSIERRKTPAERAAEIERLKALAEEQAAQVHERDGEGQQDAHEREGSSPDEGAGA